MNNNLKTMAEHFSYARRGMADGLSLAVHKLDDNIWESIYNLSWWRVHASLGPVNRGVKELMNADRRK